MDMDSKSNASGGLRYKKHAILDVEPADSNFFSAPKSKSLSQLLLPSEQGIV